MLGSKLRFGFKSKWQGPLFMIWREYFDDYGVYDAIILYSTDKPLPFKP